MKASRRRPPSEPMLSRRRVSEASRVRLDHRAARAEQWVVRTSSAKTSDQTNRFLHRFQAHIVVFKWNIMERLAYLENYPNGSQTYGVSASPAAVTSVKKTPAV